MCKTIGRQGSLKAKIDDKQILFCPTRKYYFQFFQRNLKLACVIFQQFIVNLLQEWRFPFKNSSNCLFPLTRINHFFFSKGRIFPLLPCSELIVTNVVLFVFVEKDNVLISLYPVSKQRKCNVCSLELPA